MIVKLFKVAEAVFNTTYPIEFTFCPASIPKAVSSAGVYNACVLTPPQFVLNGVEVVFALVPEPILPEDSIIADKFDNNANTKLAENAHIPPYWMGLDIGHDAIRTFQEVIKNSKTILWNGPMGVFEMEKFQNGTKSIAVAVAHATQNGAFSLVGGGDSVAAVNKFGLAKQVSFVSTGGGALLEFFEGKTLPGVAALM